MLYFFNIKKYKVLYKRLFFFFIKKFDISLDHCEIDLFIYFGNFYLFSSTKGKKIFLKIKISFSLNFLTLKNLPVKKF